jgi:hypothetical protein
MHSAAGDLELRSVVRNTSCSCTSAWLRALNYLGYITHVIFHDRVRMASAEKYDYDTLCCVQFKTLHLICH